LNFFIHNFAPTTPFQGEQALKNVLEKHYNPHGIGMLKEIYEKANY